MVQRGMQERPRARSAAWAPRWRMAGGSLTDVNYWPCPQEPTALVEDGLFDEVICPPEHRRRNRQAKRFCGLEVDDELESCGLLDGQVGRPRALQDLVHIMRRPAKLSVVAQAIGH